ncbi:MAG: GTP-binding protein, partial [Pseudomonadota bacterium]
FYMAGFITLFDVISGSFSIENHFEVIKQIAFADRIVLTKTDLKDERTRQSDITELSNGLREINASAEIVDRVNINLSALFSPRFYSAVDQGDDVAGWLALEAALEAEAHHIAQPNIGEEVQRHGSGIQTFSIVADQPLPEKRIEQFLSTLRSSAGQRLLRVKGIIATEESPDNPLIVHAVQHVMSEPVRVDAWPDEDRRTRLVFITSGIDSKPVRELFAAVIFATPFSLTKWFQHLGSAINNSLFKRLIAHTNESRRSP